LPEARLALEPQARRTSLVIEESFFYSSRRRHTRFSRDWSSDVCSSDLSGKQTDKLWFLLKDPSHDQPCNCCKRGGHVGVEKRQRSEERRVGKECRTRWGRDH